MDYQWEDDKKQFSIFQSVTTAHFQIFSIFERALELFEQSIFDKERIFGENTLRGQWAKLKEFKEKFTLLQSISESQKILMLRDLVAKVLKKRQKHHNLCQNPSAASNISQINIKKFKCSICDKAYNHRSSLRKHRRSVHEKIKDYKCEKCESAFPQRYHLNVHQQVVHDKIKNFKCIVCSRAFGRRADLKRHEEVHSIIKCFKCCCNMVFLNKTDLADHQKNSLECQNNRLAQQQ